MLGIGLSGVCCKFSLVSTVLSLVLAAKEYYQEFLGGEDVAWRFKTWVLGKRTHAYTHAFKFRISRVVKLIFVYNDDRSIQEHTRRATR
jgi:hypothetical protein